MSEQEAEYRHELKAPWRILYAPSEPPITSERAALLKLRAILSEAIPHTGPNDLLKIVEEGLK